MALNLYGGGEGISQPARQVVGGAQETGRRTGTQLFGSKAAQGSFLQEARRHEYTVGNAIDNLGIEAASWSDEQIDKVSKSIYEDMKELRIRANEARLQGDMQEHQLALNQILFDKQMAAQVETLRNARIGNLITGLVQGIGQALGHVGGMIYERRNPLPNIYDQLAPAMTEAGRYSQPASSPWEQQAWNTGSQY